jgi:Fe-S cluster assembly protein SufD
MSTEITKSDSLVEQFIIRKDLDGVSSDFLSIQDNAKKRLDTLSLPSAALEDWKYTNLKPLFKSGVKLPRASSEGIEPPAQVSSFKERIVLINGRVEDALSNLSGDTCVQIISAQDSLPLQFLHERSGKETGSNEGPKRSSGTRAFFPLLNDYLMEEVVYIEVPEGAVSKLEITHISNPSDTGEIRSPRLFVFADTGSTIEVVEHFIGYADGLSVTNHVAEFVVKDNATVTHYKIQRESKDTIHLSHVYSEQAEHCVFKNVNLQFGGSLSRNEIYPSLPGSYSEAWLIGTNMLSDSQHVDNFTVIDHIAPHCESHELYKGVYASKSKGVFSGTIIVQREAQKTNAYQSNASLLLSEDSESYSKPQLKIWADDVKCSHGATIGQIDEDALFYLRARGIPEHEARGILTRAYVSDVLAHIEDPSLSAFIEEVLDAKLKKVVS